MTTYGEQIVHSGNRTCGGSGGGQKLHEIFAKEVINNRVVWYVDYFTEDGANYSVRYLVDDGANTIMMTNENRERRDPNEKWNSEDVEPWFKKNDVSHTMLFLFNHTDTSEVFGIYCAAGLVFAFGSRALMLAKGNMWDTYLVDGILGAMKACGDATKSKLEAIVANPRMEILDKHGLRQEFVLGMTAAIDG